MRDRGEWFSRGVRSGYQICRPRGVPAVDATTEVRVNGYRDDIPHGNRNEGSKSVGMVKGEQEMWKCTTIARVEFIMKQ